MKKAVQKIVSIFSIRICQQNNNTIIHQLLYRQSIVPYFIISALSLSFLTLQSDERGGREWHSHCTSLGPATIYGNSFSNLQKCHISIQPGAINSNPVFDICHTILKIFNYIQESITTYCSIWYIYGLCEYTHWANHLILFLTNESIVQDVDLKHATITWTLTILQHFIVSQIWQLLLLSP
jgi:hypothetical protein